MSVTKTVAVSGGFDPVHIGHVRLLKEARSLGDRLVVILNNDNWLVAKKGFVFMPEAERIELLREFSFVDDVVLTTHGIDDADRSVCKALQEISPDIFANGGDRRSDNVPELQLCIELGISTVFNVGAGGKVQSSSDMVRSSLDSLTTVHRPWGFYKNHESRSAAHLKTLHINPGKRLSLQKHQERDETWILVEGDALAYTGPTVDALEALQLSPHVPFHVPRGMLHRLSSTQGCVIVEVIGGNYREDDIERLADDYGRINTQPPSVD